MLSRHDAPTPAQLKHGIAHKVPGFDPAAAPLGTDDEAAGTPPTPQALTDARARRGPARPSPEAMEPGYTARVWAWVAIAMAAVGGAVFLMM